MISIFSLVIVKSIESEKVTGIALNTDKVKSYSIGEKICESLGLIRKETSLQQSLLASVCFFIPHFPHSLLLKSNNEVPTSSPLQ